MGPINTALNKTDNTSIDGIIGVDFLLRNNTVLNFEKMKLYI